MFIVCEPIALGMEHVPFNASLLTTICIAFPNDEISFYAENDHAKFVQEQIGEELKAAINWRELVLPARHSKFLSRLSSDFRTIKFLLEKLECDHKKDVLVVTGNASILWALKYYTRSVHKNKKIQVVVHGNFSTLTRIPRREILNPLYYVGSLKTALKLPGYQRLQHIVLEEAVRYNVLRALPFLKDQIYVLDHPIPIDKKHDNNEAIMAPKKDLPIEFGYLGRATKQKGFFNYLEVATEISKRFPGRAKFHFIGRVSEKVRHSNINKIYHLTEMPNKERLSRSDYADRVKRLHYVCLFNDSYYDFCASGVLMDSIAWKKPIVASELMLFKTIQNRFGEIGYLCKPDEIVKTITNIINKRDDERYKNQVENLGLVKASRKPENLSIKYRHLVDLLEFNK
jgi:glycosyltransferase involved in cell wall biosynthesis